MSTKLSGQQLHDTTQILKAMLSGETMTVEQLEDYGFRLVGVAHYERLRYQKEKQLIVA